MIMLIANKLTMPDHKELHEAQNDSDLINEALCYLGRVVADTGLIHVSWLYRACCELDRRATMSALQVTPWILSPAVNPLNDNPVADLLDTFAQAGIKPWTPDRVGLASIYRLLQGE